MSYIPKLTMLYSYFPTSKVDPELLQAFFGKDSPNFVETEFNKNHKQVADIKGLLEQTVDIASPAKRQVEEALFLIFNRQSSGEEVMRITHELIKNIYFPKWTQEDIKRFKYFYKTLKFKFKFFFSYTNNNVEFFNELFNASFEVMLKNRINKVPPEHAFAKAIMDRLKYSLPQAPQGFDAQLSKDMEERGISCQEAHVFIQLICDTIFQDDDCFQDFKMANNPPNNPIYYEYILSHDKLEDIVSLDDLPEEKKDWYRHIEAQTDHVNTKPILNVKDLDAFSKRIKQITAKEKREKFIQNQVLPSNCVLPGETRKLILFCSATPHNLDKLDTRQEFFTMLKILADELQQSNAKDEYYIIPAFHSSLETLKRLMINFNPEIVHFAGHGSQSDGIYFEQEDGIAVPIPVDALAAFFGLVGKNIQCVLLNACYSEWQAEAIKAQGIKYVIGTTDKIRNSHAINFSNGFYPSYFKDADVKRAYQLGVNEVQAYYGDQNLIKLLE